MIIKPGREPTPPGEWEVDSDGKRFRFDGRCIEYEPTIQTSAGTVTLQQLKDMQAREKDKPAYVPESKPPAKSCPLETGMHSNCKMDACAWFVEGRCAQKCPHPAAGKKCPYKGTNCTNSCAMR